MCFVITSKFAKKTALSKGTNCSSNSKGLTSPRTLPDGGRKSGLFAFTEAATRHDLSVVRVLWAKFNTCELCKDILEEPESALNCKILNKYHSDGRITSFTSGQHLIADPLPMLVCSVDELVEIEDGKHASSRQWIRCTGPAKFHRMKLMNEGWSHRKQIVDSICSICSSSKTKDWLFWQTDSNAIILNDSMRTDCLVKVVINVTIF